MTATWDAWEHSAAENAAHSLDMLDASDPEVAHGWADKILLALAPTEVQDAHARLTARCSWWAAA